MEEGNYSVDCGNELYQLSPEDVQVETVPRTRSLSSFQMSKSPNDDAHSPYCLTYILCIPGSML